MLGALLLAAAFTNHPYAATPQRAALGAVGHGSGVSPVVVRLNVAGRYAAVLTKGGIMEGDRVTEPILVERFSFGWQPLEILEFRCRLTVHRLSPHVEAALMQRMPAMKSENVCGFRDRDEDAGPPAEVDAVRKLMSGPLVPRVAVSGVWAIGEWYGAGGGEKLYRRSGNGWTFIAGGGGAMGMPEMVEYRVPRSAWCVFRIYNARCG